MRQAALALGLLVFGSPLHAGLLSSRANSPDLAAAALDAPVLRGARVAALALRCADSTVVVARNPDERLAPASNQKILTVLAALAALGPAHRFVTRVYADRSPDGNGEVETLALHGGGDPALTSEEWWRLSADLRRAGLRRVRGDILLDDSAFDQQRWNPAWGDRSARAYYPAVGALMANYGSFTVAARPGERPGVPLLIAVDPPLEYLRVVNQATTRDAGGAETLQVDRQAAPDAEGIMISGEVPLGSPLRLVHRSVTDPTRYAGAVLAMQLNANGITVGGTTRLAAVPPGAVELLAYAGKPLADIVRLLMKYSNNGIAETLIKALAVDTNGDVGTWERGVARVRQSLGSLGISTDGVTLLDGSGLAPGNRVSPRVLVTALCRARSSFAVGPEFVAALPISGADGTLGERGVAAGVVRAKTGMLSGVVALSGYASPPAGDEVTFSIIVNGAGGSETEIMRAVDAFANALADAPVPPR